MQIVILFILAALMASISGALLVSIPWLAITQGNATDVALYFGLYALSGLCYQPIAGLVADFFQERKVFVLVNLVKAFAILICMQHGLTHHFTKYLVPFLISLSDTQFRTMSGRLLKNISVNNSIENINSSKLNANYFGAREIGYIVGTACAGYSIYYIGMKNSLEILAAATLFAGLISIFITNTAKIAIPFSQTNIMDILSISFILKQKQLRLSITMFTLIAIPLRLAPMIASPLVYNVLKSPPLVLGNMELAWSIGAVAANTFIGSLYKENMHYNLKILSILFLLLSFSSILVANSISIVLTYFFIGLFGQIFVLYYTEIQTLALADNIGRVSSISNFISTLPILVYTFMAQLFDIQNYYVPLCLCISSLIVALTILNIP